MTLIAAEDITGVAPGKPGDGSGAMPGEALLHREGDVVSTLRQDDAGIFVSGDVPCGSYEIACAYARNGDAGPESTVKLADCTLDGGAPKALFAAIAAAGVDGDDTTMVNWDVRAVPAFVAPEKLNRVETNADGKLEILRLPSGTYGFSESRSLPGYLIDASARYLTIADDGLIDGDQVGRLLFENQRTHLEVAKVDAATEEPVAGAQLELYAAPEPGVLDEAGNPVKYGKLYDAWTSGEEPRIFEAIPAGDYILHEVVPPESYFLGADVALTVDGTTAEVQMVKIANDYTRVDVAKVDADTDAALPGAALALKDAEGSYVDPREYVVPDEATGLMPEFAEIVFGDDGSPSGTAPLGSSDKVSWTLKDAWGKTTAEWEGATPPADAVLAALLEAGGGSKMVKSTTPADAAVCWTSTEGPVRFEGLQPGAYTLVEVAPPEGYLMAEPVEVEIRAVGEVQAATMEDEIDAEAYDKTGVQLGSLVPLAAFALAAACAVVAASLRRSNKRRA